MSGRLLTWIRRLVTVVMLVAIAWVLIAKVDEGIAVAANLGTRFAASALVGLVGLVCAAASWSVLVGSSIRDGISTFGTTLPLRHLPLGGVGQMAGMSGLSVVSGTSGPRVAQATPLFLVATVAGASAVAAPVIWTEEAPSLLRGLVASVALGSVLLLVVGEKLANQLKGRLSLLGDWSSLRLLAAMGWSALSTVAAGGAFALLFPFAGLVETVIGFASAWVVGFLFVVAPAGLGIREAAMLALWPEIDAATIVAASVAHRFSTFSAEIALFILGSWYTRQWQVESEIRGRLDGE